jgi:hypothetical protein
VALALRADRWIELRVIAIDTAAALDLAIALTADPSAPTTDGTGVELATALADPDPAIRGAAIAVVPAPVPAALRTTLAGAVIRDTDPAVALAAAQVLCFDLVADPPGPILDALGAPGLSRIRSLVTGPGPRTAIRDAKRCLAAAKQKPKPRKRR